MINEKELVLALLKHKGLGNKKVYEFVKANDFCLKHCIDNLGTIVSGNEFDTCLIAAKEELEANEDLGITVLTLFDFPQKFFIKNDPVVFLYCLGDTSLLYQKSIAIIGTRQASAESLEKATRASAYFAEKGYVIVSGLALGVDTAAHSGCLEVQGKTIATLPCGLNHIIPPKNTELARQIVRTGGCVISEYSVGTEVHTFNYAKRDRIQAALSEAVLVIEADEKSGTMYAVNTAKNNNRPVFQVIGNNNKEITNNVNIDNPNDLQIIENAINTFSDDDGESQLSLFDTNKKKP